MRRNFFQKYLNFKTPRAFGANFNDSSIKIMQTSGTGKKCHVNGYAKKNLPKGVIEDCEIKDVALFSDIFKSAISLAKGKIKGSAVAVAVPENKVFIRIIKVPALSRSEIAETIKWETESNIPISMDEVYFDWQIVKREEETTKVLVVACGKKIIDNYLHVFDGMGIEVLVFEPESVAAGRCVIKTGEENPVVLIDIGSTETSISIYENGFPVFTSGSSFSGSMVTDMISKNKGIGVEKAEIFKIRTGMGGNIEEKQELEKILQPLISGFVLEIERVLKFYAEKLSQGGKQKISKIILSGGGSNLKGLSSCLAIKLRTQVDLANPWENFDMEGKLPGISKNEAEKFVTAIGLAIRANNYEDYN